MLRFLKFKLFWKFFSYFFIAQLAAILAVGYLISLEHHADRDKRQQDNHPAARMLRQSIAKALRDDRESEVIAWLKASQAPGAPQMFVVDEHNRDLLGRELPETYDADWTADTLPEAVDEVTTHSGKHYRIWAIAGNFPLHPKPYDSEMPLGPGGPPPDRESHFERPPPDAESPGFLIAGGPDNPPLFPLIPLAVGILVSFFTAMFLAWNVSKPIRLLRESFDEAALGNLDIAVSDKIASRRDEFSELAQGFDRMVAQLKQLIQGQTRLLHHVSHEMRSPLARMQIALGLARQSPSHIDSTLDRIELELGRMDHLVGEVLDLSRMDSGLKKITKEKINLCEMLEEIVEDASFEAKTKRISIELECSHSIEWAVNPDLLFRAIENLVRNAIKYSFEGGHILLATRIDTDRHLHIIVSDQGPGILENEFEDLFKPFFRGQLSKSEKGYGLGLAITKQIIELHGGTISARNNQPKGLLLEIRLPDDNSSQRV